MVSTKSSKWILRRGTMSFDTIGMLPGNWVRSLTCAVVFCSLLFLKTAPSGGQGLQVDNKATAAEIPSADAHPILVELFTSEGCSSCPPADAFLEKLDHFHPVAGSPLIVLSEHVDYWDHDGWKDPNSSPALTERQSAYEGALGLKTPYTPQFIVDGTTEFRMDDLQKADKVFQDAAADPKIPVRIGEVSVDAGNPTTLRTRVEADVNSGKHNADIYVAVALDRVESQVLHGENGGHRLTHVAVVVNFTKIGKAKKGQNFAETVELKLKPGTDSKNARIVAFVQESGPGRILGVALRRPAS
jgi:hypothetical protein